MSGLRRYALCAAEAVISQAALKPRSDDRGGAEFTSCLLQGPIRKPVTGKMSTVTDSDHLQGRKHSFLWRNSVWYLVVGIVFLGGSFSLGSPWGYLSLVWFAGALVQFARERTESGRQRKPESPNS
jgi:hypothetical protein